MLRPIQVSLDAGQLDERMAARQDAQMYGTGLYRATNWQPMAQGGIRNRPAFQAQAAAVGSAKRMIPFDFDETERYLITLAQTELRFFRVAADDTVTLVQQTSIVPFWTSITDQEIREITYAHRYDIMILAHRNLPPLQLFRTGLESFAVDRFQFEQRTNTEIVEAPTYRFTGQGITCQPCDVNGNGVASVSKNATAYLQWFGVDSITGLPYDPSIIELGSIVRYQGVPMAVTAEADGNARIQAKALNDLHRTKRLSISYEAGANSNSWLLNETVVCPEDNGEGIITAAGPTNIDVIIVRGDIFTEGAVITGAESGAACKLTAGSAYIEMAPTPWWEETVYSAYRGYFSAACFFSQRLWIGGSWDQPAMLCASKIQNFANFDLGEGGDTDAIQVILSATDPGQIRYLVDGRHLQIFTTTGEHYVGENRDQVISPETISLNGGSRFGAGQCMPKVFAGDVYFVDRSNQQVRPHGWDDVQQIYKAPPLGFGHQDLLPDIKEIHPAYTLDSQPHELLYVVNADGTLVVMAEVEILKTLGFWPWTFTSGVDSLAIIDNKPFILSGGAIHRVLPGTPSEADLYMKTQTLVFQTQEGTSRGQQIRQGKVELEVVDTATDAITINGRAVTPGQPATGRIDHWMLGWAEDPRIEISVPAGNACQIIALLQEVSQ